MMQRPRKPDFCIVMEYTTFSKLDATKPTDRKKLGTISQVVTRNLIKDDASTPLSVNDKSARFTPWVTTRLMLDPKDQKHSFRLCFPYVGHDLSYRERVTLSELFHERLVGYAEQNPLLKDLQIKAVGLAMVRSPALMAGHASAAEITEQSMPQPGEKVRVHNPGMEDKHPNGIVDRVEGDLVHCFDEDDEEFSYRQLPL